MTAPERIWTASTNGKCHVGFDAPSLNYTNEYVRADLAAVPAQVRVKPLVWDEPRDANNWVNIARSVFGDYYISIDGGRCSAWLEAHVKPYENKIGDDVGSVIEAMMLAERDYEAKTRALIIEPQPDPRDAQIAALVEAIQANIVFAENIADALDVDPDKTCLNVRVMPEGREVASKSWADVMREGRAAIAAVKGGDA